MLTQIGLLLLTAVPLMGSPGPATMSVAAVGAAYGARRGIAHYFGIAAGTSCVCILVATGVTGALLAAPFLGTVIVIAAAAYILYLAWKIATAPPIGQVRTDIAAPRFAPALALAITNPKAYAAIGAAYSGHAGFGLDPLQDAAFKVAILIAVALSVNLAWLGFGAAVARFLRHPVAGRIANWTFAFMLLASVGLVLWTELVA